MKVDNKEINNNKNMGSKKIGKKHIGKEHSETGRTDVVSIIESWTTEENNEKEL